MKILVHGNSLQFLCENCGCIWLATKNECRRRHYKNEGIDAGYDYVYNCPECTTETIGKDRYYEKARNEVSKEHIKAWRDT